MTKITQEKLIELLKQARQIKPRAEWVSLLKSQILVDLPASATPKVLQAGKKANFAGFVNDIYSAFSPRKLAYSLAVVLFMVAGFLSYDPIRKVMEHSNSQAGQLAVNQNVTDLSNKISELTKNLNTNPLNNIDTAKRVADEVKTIRQLQAKTFADVPGTPEEKSLNDALNSVNNTLAPLVESEINDLEKTTLTEDQNKILLSAEDLYNQGKFTDALEKILSINQ